MKRIATLICFVLISATLYAQRIDAYLVLGGVASQVEGDELKGFGHWGLHGGVGAWVRLDDRDTWGLAIETDYSCRGIFNNSGSAENYYNIDLDLHYIDIPVTAFFRDPYGGLRLGAGLVYSRLVSQPHGYIRYTPTYFVPDTADMQFLKNDLAAAVEARFTIWNGLQFSLRYQYSILPVKKNWHFYMQDESWANNCYNSSLSLRLVWQFGYDRSASLRKKNLRHRR
jgi:hypothetical protein